MDRSISIKLTYTLKLVMRVHKINTKQRIQVENQGGFCCVFLMSGYVVIHFIKPRSVRGTPRFMNNIEELSFGHWELCWHHMAPLWCHLLTWEADAQVDIYCELSGKEQRTDYIGNSPLASGFLFHLPLQVQGLGELGAKGPQSHPWISEQEVFM